MDKKRGISFTNKWFYSFITLILILLFAVGVYAADVGSTAGFSIIAAPGSDIEGGQIDFQGALSYETWTVDSYVDQFRIFKESTSTDNTDQVKIFNANGGMGGGGIAGLYVEGNVGIGTENPGAKLQITSNGVDTIRFGDGTITYPTNPSPYTRGMLVGRGPTSDYRLSIQDGSGRVNQYWNAYFDSTVHKYIVSSEGANDFLISNGSFVFKTASNGTAGGSIPWKIGLSQDVFGNVGIGTERPSQKLDVNGTINVLGDALFSGNVGIATANPQYTLEVDGDIGAEDFLYTSDERLKENIIPLSNSLDKLQNLQGVSFNWKENGERSIGLIAQDVEKIYPELVSTDNNGMKSVRYGNLVAPLIEAVKEQQKKIEEQEKRINYLEKEIEMLKN